MPSHKGRVQWTLEVTGHDEVMVDVCIVVRPVGLPSFVTLGMSSESWCLLP